MNILQIIKNEGDKYVLKASVLKFIFNLKNSVDLTLYKYLENIQYLILFLLFKILITNIYNKPVNLVYIDTLHSNFFKLQFTINYKSYSVISRNKTLLENLKNYKLPYKLIIKHNGRVDIPS